MVRACVCVCVCVRVWQRFDRGTQKVNGHLGRSGRRVLACFGLRFACSGLLLRHRGQAGASGGGTTAARGEEDERRPGAGGGDDLRVEEVCT